MKHWSVSIAREIELFTRLTQIHMPQLEYLFVSLSGVAVPYPPLSAYMYR